MPDLDRPRVLVLSGGTDFSDEWHPFAATSAALAGILGEPGVLGEHGRVTVSSDVVHALTTIPEDGAAEWDLLVVNVGSGGVPTPDDRECVDGIERWVAADGPMLVLHAAASLFPDDERWERMIGGRWVRGTSMHPPHGNASIRVTAPRHPVTDGLEDFVLSDERYSYLRVGGDVSVLATHEHDGLEHGMLWARELDGARVVYDGLGHDPRSYESPEHARLLVSAARWLLREV